MASLLGSSWAPLRLRDAPRPVTRLDELPKLHRLLRRVRWKSSLLLISYQRATVSGFDTPNSREGHTMFKLDFFEFYVLLERLLVHLLGIFRVTVNGSTSTHSQNGYQDGGKNTTVIIGSSTGFLQYHRFHAEVLRSLDQPSNPLHPILGVEPVRTHLQAAKDFRNAWKDAVDLPRLATDQIARGLHESLPRDRLLEDLDLETMLQSIVNATAVALEFAENDVNKDMTLSGSGNEYGHPDELSTRVSSDTMDCDGEEIPCEAVSDGMDWE